VLPEAPNQKLGILMADAELPVGGLYQRAQADAEMAAHPTIYLDRALMDRFGLAKVTHDLLGRIQRTAKARIKGARSGAVRTETSVTDRRQHR
jgi:DNA polymerase III subunit epsilon